MSFLRAQSLFCFLLLVGVNQIFAFKCYTCNIDAEDFTCLTNPAQVGVGSPITDCTGGWCVIMRQEVVELPGKVRDFRRDCERSPPRFLDEIVEDDHFKTFFRSCRTELCNKGDGTTSLMTGGGDGSGQGERGGIILVGSESSVSRILCNQNLIILILITIFFYHIKF